MKKIKLSIIILTSAFLNISCTENAESCRKKCAEMVQRCKREFGPGNMGCDIDGGSCRRRCPDK
ncbi:MAG: hypothetical protein LBU89_06585 [Fibromonadaceae bacterium]|nr:hypothetical protein [Fibromonadaceae bacterium]